MNYLSSYVTYAHVFPEQTRYFYLNQSSFRECYLLEMKILGPCSRPMTQHLHFNKCVKL